MHIQNKFFFSTFGTEENPVAFFLRADISECDFVTISKLLPSPSARDRSLETRGCLIQRRALARRQSCTCCRRTRSTCTRTQRWIQCFPLFSPGHPQLCVHVCVYFQSGLLITRRICSMKCVGNAWKYVVILSSQPQNSSKSDIKLFAHKTTILHTRLPPKLVSDFEPSALCCVFFALVSQSSRAFAQLK